jgi:hypothetical protein
VNHVGRRSGRLYDTPVNILSGRDRRRTIELTNPELFTDPSRRHVPPPARWVLGLLHVADFLAMTAPNAADEPPNGDPSVDVEPGGWSGLNDVGELRASGERGVETPC